MLEFDGTNADKEEEITITIIDDPRDEDNQSFTVQLGDVSNVTRLDGGAGTITIEDDDAEPMVTIADITPQLEDDGMDPASDTVYNIDVTLSEASEKAVSVDFTVTAGTAVATHDYVLANSGTTLTFDNESTTKQITLNLKADNIDENDETFNVQLTSANNAQLGVGANTPKTVTINDNDDPPVISIDNVEATEGTDPKAFTITQTPNSGKTVEVTVTYADVSATEGMDKDYQITTTGFDETTNTKTFVFDPANEPAAKATLPLTFTINDDALNEDVETFTVTLSNPTSSPNFTLDTTNNTHIGTATINDNDEILPKLTIADAIGKEGTTSNGTVEFTPTLSQESGRDILITYSTSPTGVFSIEANDYEAETDEKIMILAGQLTPDNPIMITTIADRDEEPNETFELEFSADFADTRDDSTAIGTIENDDGKVLAITSATVGEDAGTASITISYSPAPSSGETVTISYETSDGTAIGSIDGSNADYTTITATDIVFDEDKNQETIQVHITDDSLYELTEEFTITASTTEPGVTALNGGVGTITINDSGNALPTLDLVKLTGNIVETTDASTNPTHNITVKLSATFSRDVQVGYSLTGLEANIPLDVKLANSAPGRISDSAGVLTIAKGETSATIPVEIIADYYDEVDEKFRVTIEDPVNADAWIKLLKLPQLLKMMTRSTKGFNS